MNKNILWIIGLLIVSSLSFASCSESSDDVDLYANWDARNQAYIDSIATVAKNNLGDEVGKWKIIKSYKLSPSELQPTMNVNDYVYCKIKAKGNGTTFPLFTDSVAANYKGMLINNEVFDSNYSGEYNPALADPMIFSLGKVIIGWTTALQQMVAGDRWELYIPSDLAYGTSGNSTIPANSTLIFDIDLIRVIPLKGNGRSVE